MRRVFPLRSIYGERRVDLRRTVPTSIVYPTAL